MRTSYLRVAADRDGRPEASDDYPQQALCEIVTELAVNYDQWIHAYSRTGPWGSAAVCRVMPGRVVHVIGDSPLAKQLRELLADGAAPGWTLHPVPPGQTPLRVLAEPLHRASGNRHYNLLSRSGFVTVEELAATPDDCLRSIFQGGPSLVAAVHAALCELGWVSSDPPGQYLSPAVTERERQITARLTAPHRLRYRDFITMLARSSLAPEEIDKMVDSLNAEPIPPADSIVCHLLAASADPELLSYYERTHVPVLGSSPT